MICIDCDRNKYDYTVGASDAWEFPTEMLTEASLIEIVEAHLSKKPVIISAVLQGTEFRAHGIIERLAPFVLFELSGPMRVPIV